ncbi:MAG: CATRA system-associated protein [Umezawaea sp.]
MDVLDDLLGWELSPGRWSEVSARLSALAAAVRTDDSADVINATVALELISPLMGPGMGKEPTVPSINEVRDKQGEIVNSLRDKPEDDHPRTG